MREFSTPLTIEVPVTGNLTDDVVTNAAEAADAVVFSRVVPDRDGWQDVTAGTFLQEVSLLAISVIPGAILGIALESFPALTGRVVEIGARTRTIPPALRRALHARDRGCRFPGCVVRFGQGHHLRHWAHGGPTTLSNLALLCRRHHRAVHEEGYQVARGPDGALRFRRPDGRPLPEVPPPAAVPGDPIEALRTCHDSNGLRIDARTACAGWLGARAGRTPSRYDCRHTPSHAVLSVAMRAERRRIVRTHDRAGRPPVSCSNLKRSAHATRGRKSSWS